MEQLYSGDKDALQIDIDFDGKRLPFANVGIVSMGGQLSGDSGERYRITATEMRPYIVLCVNNHQPLLDALRAIADGSLDRPVRSIARAAIQAAADDVDPAYEAAEAQRGS